MCSGKEIAPNNWCSGEPKDWDGHDERELIIDATHGLCFHDGIGWWALNYMCKQGMCMFCFSVFPKLVKANADVTN